MGVLDNGAGREATPRPRDRRPSAGGATEREEWQPVEAGEEKGASAVYGTIARLRVNPDKLDELRRFGEEQGGEVPGLVFQHVYRSDADPNEVWLVVGFASREAYHRNAQSPEQQARYAEYRALLEADPEWHDGEIVQ
jgi:quinol monooxygenase YgiN